MILGSLISVMGVDYIDVRAWLVNVCMAIWSMRLSIYVACRHSGEDWRYADMRKQYEIWGKFAYYILSFLLIFMLQAGATVAVI